MSRALASAAALARSARRRSRLEHLGLAGALTLLSAVAASALPEFTVEASRSCSNCHVAPHDWPNPDVRYRKCTLNCNGCHVNPTGGGMRHEAGRFYARHLLSILDDRRDERAPAPGGVPEPLSRERYAGLSPQPRVQAGADFRTMGLLEAGRDPNHAFFPMQADVHLAVRPYSPRRLNRGRLTLLATGGAQGSRAATFGDPGDRLFVKEWWALFHDLPYQLYLKAGRFLPPFGWRLDDHTAFVRQTLSFDFERQGTGVEIGFNPNYAYAHLAVQANTRDGTAPVPDDGWNASVAAGYRDFWWQLGAQAMFEERDDATEWWLGATWALSPMRSEHPWKGLNVLPVTYMGELDVRRTEATAGRRVGTGLAAMHQLTWHPRDGIRALVRYDWVDLDTELVDDHRWRLVLGLVVHPTDFFEQAVHYRRNDSPALTDRDELIFMSHVYF
jgi:hypothetical protein